MASHSLLHIIRRPQTFGTQVQSHPATYMACVPRSGLEYNWHFADNNIQLVGDGSGEIPWRIETGFGAVSFKLSCLAKLMLYKRCFRLSFSYRRNGVALRAGRYLSAASLVSYFAGALAHGITSGNGSSQRIASWCLLFFFEGMPGVVMAVVVFFLCIRSEAFCCIPNPFMVCSAYIARGDIPSATVRLRLCFRSCISRESDARNLILFYGARRMQSRTRRIRVRHDFRSKIIELCAVEIFSSEVLNSSS